MLSGRRPGRFARPSPKVDATEATAAKYAADWPAWGHRKLAAMMRADGHHVSTSTRERALRLTLKYEHLYRAIIDDGNALAVEVNCFRHTYNTLRPHQALGDRTPRQAYLASLGSQ